MVGRKGEKQSLGSSYPNKKTDSDLSLKMILSERNRENKKGEAVGQVSVGGGDAGAETIRKEPVCINEGPGLIE